MRNRDYLMSRNGVWYLRFRVPARFGGDWVKISLKTNDVAVAKKIRDKYVRPVLAADSACGVFEAIAKQLTEIGEEIPEHLDALRGLIANKGGADVLVWSDAAERYAAWLQKSGAAPKTLTKYAAISRWLADRLGPDEPVNHLAKSQCAAIRDVLVLSKKSPATIDCYFMVAKGWMSWLGREGLVDGERLRKCWRIDLPVVRKENTRMIPPQVADAAEQCLPGWLLPRLARYTGMRLNEVLAVASGRLGCGVVEVDGVLCFSLSETMTKTHKARYVPVPRQIENIARDANMMAEVGKRGLYLAKCYNQALKSVAGCEECSFHSWRVYANTMMMEAGVEENLRRRALGHADGKDTHYGYSAGRLQAIKVALEKIP